jgi:environmental stress-induced protein Ves
MELLRSRRGIRIEYTSPMARALRAEEGTAIMNSVQDLGVMAQIDPTVRSVMDLHEAFREMAQIRGTSPKLIRSDEEVDKLMQHAAQQQQQAQAAASVVPASQSALNLAKAAQAANQAGGSTAGAPSVPQG